jgi:hypothetical protein
MFRLNGARRVGRRGLLGLLVLVAAALAVPAAANVPTAVADSPRAALVKEGHFDLYLTREFTAALRSAGITPYSVVPGSQLSSWDVPVFRIPLRGGELQTNPYSGRFTGGWLHFATGGIGFRKGDQRVEFTRFDADLTRGEVRAAVNGDTLAPFTVLRFRISPDQVRFSSPVADIDGVSARFTPEAAVLMNTAFRSQLLSSDSDAVNYSARVILHNGQ